MPDIRAMALVSAGVLLVSACDGNHPPSLNLAPNDKQILRVNDGTEPNSYDPTQQTYSYEAAVGREYFEPLLKSKPDLSDVSPGAAKSYSVSSDGLTYTFKLQNAKWSDGKPVTASDWVYGFQHLLNPALGAGYVDPFFDTTIAGASDYGNVDVSSASAVDGYIAGLGLSAPDPNTFVIKLANPAAYFKWVVTLSVAIPLRKDIVQSAAGGSFASTDTTKPEMWANTASTIVGNGPFKISEIVARDHVTLVPNPYYWGGAPKLEQVVYYFISDGTSAFSKYQTGALDIIHVPIAYVTVVKGDAKLSKQARLLPRLTTVWMTFNTKKAPFDNPKVRMAFAKAIDRDKLVDVEHGTIKPFSTFIPNGMGGYDTSDNAQSYDPAAAKKLLADAGVSASTLNAFKLLTRNTTRDKTDNQFIVNQWNTNLGLNIQLDVIDTRTVASRLRKGSFDIYGPDGWGADYPDQQDWFDIFSAGACHALNWGCPTLAGYDALIQKADTELNQMKRNADYLTAQKMLIDQAAVGFIFQQYEYDLIQPYVGNLSFNAFDDEYTPGNQAYQAVYITAH